MAALVESKPKTQFLELELRNVDRFRQLYGEYLAAGGVPPAQIAAYTEQYRQLEISKTRILTRIREEAVNK